MAWLRTLWSNFASYFALPDIMITDILEIIIIAILLYRILVWVRDSRAWFVFRGIFFLVIAVVLAAVFQFNTILYIVEKFFSVLVIALLVIFQPELRKALESLGRRKGIFRFFFGRDSRNADGFSMKQIDELITTSFELANRRTGALIVLEKDVPLNDFVNTGIEIDAVLSASLLINIFEHNTPLHDGAVIIREDRIVAATCYLPLSADNGLSKELGTRHRAAVGMSEATDSITIVVSEETGAVSVAEGGKLMQNISELQLRRILKTLMPEESTSRFSLFRRRGKNETETHA